MTRASSGFGLVEALVALALAAIAFGALAASAHVAVQSFRRSAAHQAAGIAALDRLEALRAGARASGADTVPGPPVVSRAWRVAAGRGRPDDLTTDAQADGSRVILETRAWP